MTNSRALAVVTGLVIASFVGVLMFQMVTSEQTQQFVEESQDWCDDHDGQVVRVMSVNHGGLHCDLPNGTSVHMNQIIDLEESA